MASPLLLIVIGVFGLFHPKELVVSPVPGGVLFLETGRILDGPLRLGTDSLTHSVTFRKGEFFLSVPGKIERRFSGRLEVAAVHGDLVATVTMDLETAVASVVAAESGPGASLEALKAQAVVARSFYAASRGRHNGFDFCDTTHCQFLREPPKQDDPAWTAASETRDLLLSYRDATVAALYSASCGGRTRSLEQAGMSAGGYPYFAVECSYCQSHAASWERRLAAGENVASERSRVLLGRKLGWSAIPGNNFNAHLEGEELVLEGRGAGHGIGLCQAGAAGMSAAGAAFRRILSHYFPNTTLDRAPRGGLPWVVHSSPF